MSSWEGTKVRHSDGRAGVIISEFVGFHFRGLTIKDDKGQEAYLELNSDGTDKWAEGWEWLCEKLEDGAKWLPLGTPPKVDPEAGIAEDLRKLQQIAAITLSAHEETMLVRLVTDRRSQELFSSDQDVKPRAMNSLVKKGMATVIDKGWRLTPTGKIRSSSIY